MSLHISAENGQIAPVVLMPGDPLRAKYMADKFLTETNLVSNTRNVFYYTGLFNGVRITIGASGMGCPSIGIYSYELYSFYDVQCIIRIGTAGAYTTDLNVYDLVNTEKAYSESTFASEAFGYPENHFLNQGNCFSIINETAKSREVKLQTAAIHSSDVFYRAKPGVPPIAKDNNCLAVEMEAFALFSTARYLKKMAGSLLTISDVIPTGACISPQEREQALLPMMELALHSGVAIMGRM
jgi:purine-nucleoside phosphorylase